MTVETIKTGLMDLSIEEQELLSGGLRRSAREEREDVGIIKVDDAVFEFGGEEYPARIFVRVEDLPNSNGTSDNEEDDED